MMINIDLMELADLSRPSQIAREIINQNPAIQFPIPIEDIAYASGIREVSRKPLEGLEGALVANPEKTEGIILIKEGARPQRQRFTLGHELGHYLIPRHGHKMSCSISDLTVREDSCSSAQARIEREANQFSSEILMPSLLVRQYLGFLSSPSIDLIREMADDFDVSFEAFSRRYVALHDEPAAIVFAHNSIVRYSVKNDDFPFWIRAAKGCRLPSKCYSARRIPITSSGSVSNGASDSCLWVDDIKGYIAPEELQEELYVMGGGYTATLIFFDDEIEEVEE